MLRQAARTLVKNRGASAVVVVVLKPGVDARDPSNYVAVALAIAVVAFLASYLPARRAASIDPLLALRQE